MALMRRFVVLGIALLVLVSCSGNSAGGSEPRAATTTTAGVAELRAQLKGAIARACTTAFTSGKSAQVVFDRRWSSLSQPKAVQAEADGCVAQRKARLLGDMNAEVQRACLAAVGGGTDPIVKAKPDWPPPQTNLSSLTAAAKSCVSITYRNKYLALVKESNCLGDDMSNQWKASKTWDQVRTNLQPKMRAYAESTVRFYEGLVAIKWPVSIQPAVDALVADLTADASYYESMSKAESVDTFNQLSDHPPDETNANSAGVVRAKLGLGSNVTDTTNYCQAG
jgi:hypothetical protein